MSSARKKGTSARSGASARGGTSARGTTSARSGGTARSGGPSSSDRGGSRGGGRSKASSSGSKQPAQMSLLDCVQTRFVKDVFESAAGADPGWKILIVDSTSMRVISAAVGMYDIMERKVTLVESLEKNRAPFKDMGAIYVLSPTEESVERLLKDYADKTKVLYGSNVFVYFLGPIPGYLLDRIKKCKQLIKRLKALSEINVDFLVREQRAFTVETSVDFSGYYLRHTVRDPAELPIAEKLVTMCATLNEYPYIRYNHTSGIASSLAQVFERKMNEFVASNPSWWYHGSGKSDNVSVERERSTLLLLDRATDCLSPLMHDLTYQSMVQDLLTMQGDKITYEADSPEDANRKEEKDVLLNEKDKIWVEMRGNHIGTVIENLSARIQETCNSSTNKAFSGQSDGSITTTDLASALKALPEYREVMSKLSQHFYISNECMNIFKRDQLLQLIDIEQTLATGQDEDGRSPKLSEMISLIEGALLRMRAMDDRLRLVLIATISQNGLTSADRERLLRAAQLGRDELLTLENLSKLGIQTLNQLAGTAAGGGLFSKGGSVKKSVNINEDSELVGARYVPPLKSILADLVANELSIDEYPSTKPLPASQSSAVGAGSARHRGRGVEVSARKKKGRNDKWAKNSNSQASSAVPTTFTGGRSLVFMIGGLAYSELRVAREVMKKESREIIIGSSKFVNPSEFMEDLATLAT